MTSFDFRITPQMTQRRTMANLQRQIETLDKLQGQVASQKALSKPSDNPVAMTSALHYRTGLGRNDQISRNINDGTTWLNLADNTLNSVVQQLQRVRQLTIQGANATSDQTARDAIATEVDHIRQTILGLANTKNGDRAIFAGNANSGIAYDANASYVGKSAAVERTVAPGVRVQINVNGDEVFGPAGNDLFTTLAQLSNDLRSNPGALSTDATALDARIKGVQDGLASVGAREQRLQTMKDRNSMDDITLKQSLSQVEDVDLAQTTLELQMQQVAYQAALQTTAKVIQPSLVDFLK